MAFTTGTAKTPAALLNALNTFLTSNGWTRLRGDTDMNMASPKAARYWRMIATRSTATTVFGLNRLHFRTTVGGANVATIAANWNVELTTGTAASLIAGGTNRASHSSSSWNTWILEYDFGSPTIVREVAMTGDATANNSPTHFAIQWSHDRITWNNMETYAGLTWSNTELKTFTYADGFVSTQHPDSTSPFRCGRIEDQGLVTFAALGVGRECNNDTWSWQGPGYDASRRVFVHMRGHFIPSTNSGSIGIWAGTGFDAATLDPNLQPGVSPIDVCLLTNAATLTYWFYVNSHRIVIVVKSGTLNYTSAYVGFLGAFVQPEYYPFPLAVLATSNSWLTTFDTANNNLSSITDPGTGMFSYRRWDTQWVTGQGRVTAGTADNNLSNFTGLRCSVWPAAFFGCNNSNNWPGSGGTNSTTSGTGRLVDRLVPTLQNEMPMFPAIMLDSEFGNVGTLSDVFAVPSGGILTPEQTITIGADTYRVFPNRDRRTNADWFAIKEAA
jgi:hypothetical protein